MRLVTYHQAGRVPGPEAGALWQGTGAGASPRQQRQQHQPSLRGAGLMSQMKPGAEDPDPERGSGAASRSHFSVRTRACLCLPPSPTDPAPLGVTSTQARAACFPGDVLPGPWLLCSMRQKGEPKRRAVQLPSSYAGKLTFIKPAPRPTVLSCRLADDVLPSQEQGLALHSGLSSAFLQPLCSRACAQGAKGLQPRRASTWVVAEWRIPSGPQVTGCHRAWCLPGVHAHAVWHCPACSPVCGSVSPGLLGWTPRTNEHAQLAFLLGKS